VEEVITIKLEACNKFTIFENSYPTGIPTMMKIFANFEMMALITDFNCQLIISHFFVTIYAGKLFVSGMYIFHSLASRFCNWLNVPGHIVTLINEIKPAVAKTAKMAGNPVNNAVSKM
jgi:hypothetical protein